MLARSDSEIDTQNDKKDDVSQLEESIPEGQVFTTKELIKRYIKFREVDRFHTRNRESVAQKKDIKRHCEAKLRADSLDFRRDILACEERFLIVQKQKVNSERRHSLRKSLCVMQGFLQYLVAEHESQKQALIEKLGHTKERVKKYQPIKDFVDKVMNCSKFRTFNELIAKHTTLKLQFRDHLIKYSTNSDYLVKNEVYLDEMRKVIKQNGMISRLEIGLLSKVLQDKQLENNKMMEATSESSNSTNYNKILLERGVRNITDKLMNFRSFARNRLEDCKTLIDQLTVIEEILTIYSEITNDHKNHMKKRRRSMKE